MTGSAAELPVALEIEPKRRTFAQAVDWPGWCRSGRDEERAIHTLMRYVGRYRAALGPLAAGLDEELPSPTVIERVDGNATTSFGAPGMVMSFDRRPLEPGGPARLAALLDACWAAFDRAQAVVPPASRGVKPPVGRSPDALRLHVLGAQRAYLSWLVKPLPGWGSDMQRAFELEPELRRIMREAVLALPVGVPFPAERHPGPYMVRRECWHVLDHAWELEDRATSSPGAG
jgi:hypothetical protein